MHWDNINIVEYGTPKENFCETPFDILFDDEEHNRENWNGIAYDVNDILGVLKALWELSKKNKKILQKVLTNSRNYGIIIMSRGRQDNCGIHERLERKNFSKTFEKPLDKLKVLWYNISVRKRGNQYGKNEKTVTRSTPQ